MGNAVVNFEIRSDDPDASREFYKKMFGWSFTALGVPGYTLVDTGSDGGIKGGIAPVQDSGPLTTFYAAVDDVGAALKKAEDLGGKIIQGMTEVPGVAFGLFQDPQGQIVGVVKYG